MVSEKKSKCMAVFGSFWQFLAVFHTNLAVFGSFGSFSYKLGSFWQFLAVFGSLSYKMAVFGSILPSFLVWQKT